MQARYTYPKPTIPSRRRHLYLAAVLQVSQRCLKLWANHSASAWYRMPGLSATRKPEIPRISTYLVAENRVSQKRSHLLS